jgi:peptide chain release factor 1
MRVLRSRLVRNGTMQKQQDALAAERTRAMVKTGDRSEENPHLQFPAKSRHRSPHRPDASISFTEVMDGKLQPLVEALVTHYQSEKLKQEAPV